MEESEGRERLEDWIRRVSRGEVGHEVDVEAERGLTLVKLHKGFVLCNFIVHNGVSDESGKWHEGAMATLMDAIGCWAASSFTSLEHVTLSLSVSCYSKPSLQEAVVVEGKAMGKNGRMTSVRVEVRNKDDGQIVAVGTLWVAPSHSNDNKPLPSKL